ncbi:MAG: hypothetical protein QM642_09430 [Edaphocola sp.]
MRFYNQDFKFENGDRLKDEHVDEYILNASVLIAVDTYKREHIAERSRKGKKATKLYEWMANECQNFNKTLRGKHKNKQHTLPTSGRQFRVVYDAFFQPSELNGQQYPVNYTALVSGKLQNDNARSLTDKVTALLDSMFAKAGTKPAKITVARRYQAFMEGLADVVNNATGELYNPADFSPLGERTVTRWLASYESKAATYSLRSADRQKLRGQFTPYLEFERPIHAGSLLSVDDRQPPFEYGPSQRLWVYNALDVASDAIVATVWGKSKEGMIMEFYRQILRNYTQWGMKLPAELEAEVSLNISFKETFLREGAMFDYVRMEANNARGKIIERRNRDFRLIHEKEMEGFIGRWHARDEANQPLPASNIYKEQKYQAYDKLVQQSLMVIEDWNNMEHPTSKGMSRWDYFTQNQNPQLRSTNWRALLPYLGYAAKTSCNLGKIRVQGVNLMIADQGDILFGEALISRLKLIEGENVTVYWLDGNDGQIMKALVYVGSEFICEGVPVPKPNRARVERTAEDEVKLQLQSKYTATVEGWINSRKRSIEAVTIIDSRPKTLNQNFVMPGLGRYVADTDTGGVLDDYNDDEMSYIPQPDNTNHSLLKNF